LEDKASKGAEEWVKQNQYFSSTNDKDNFFLIFRKRTSSIFGNPATQYLATPQSLN